MSVFEEYKAYKYKYSKKLRCQTILSKYMIFELCIKDTHLPRCSSKLDKLRYIYITVGYSTRDIDI